jgi:methionyl-tRNA synthetase
MAALLHRRQAERQGRRHRLQPDDFVARVNSDLIGKYVNIASRAAGFIAKRFDGAAPPSGRPPTTPAGKLRGVADEIAASTTREYGKALREIMELADAVNAYVDANKPWELAKDSSKDAQLHDVCTTCSKPSAC